MTSPTRVVFGDSDLPSLATGGRLRVFLELHDHLESTTTIIDKATSELVEKTGYAPYGGVEHDYRPGRWKSFREDYRFTGKEEDAELGLTYFGQRYLAALLGRWISADPLRVHVPTDSDVNLYAYVEGRVLAFNDPTGLQGMPAVPLPFGEPTRAPLRLVPPPPPAPTPPPAPGVPRESPRCRDCHLGHFRRYPS